MSVSTKRVFAFIEAMAIEAASEASRYEREGHGPAATLYRERIEALHIAADAIREKLERENPKPLTLEELRQMDGEPVYVVPKGVNTQNQWCILYISPRFMWSEALMGGIEHFAFGFEDYGKTWSAYRHKPKEVQG